MLLPLLDSVPAVSGRRGRPRRRPDKLHADNAYDHKRLRGEVRRRGITVPLARKDVESSQRLGKHRWVIERTMCAARRSVVSPVQPGGTRREVPGSAG